MPTNHRSTSDNPPQGINRRHLVLRLIFLPVFIALFMFLPAGTWAWPKGWLFVLVLLGVISAVFLVLHRVNPEVIVARSRFHKGMKGWDKILLSFYFPAMLAVILVAALDDGRFHWFPVPWWVCGVGYALLLGGIGIVTWAEGVNKFFEVTVRIQTDRGHNPTSDSHLEVEFTDADGQSKQLIAGGYFESGYRGSIRVEIKDGQIDKFEDNTKSW